MPERFIVSELSEKREGWAVYEILDTATGEKAVSCPDPEAIPNLEEMRGFVAAMEDDDVLKDYF